MTVSDLALVTTMPDRIEDLDDVKRWIAANDARAEERWKRQQDNNDRAEAFGHRLSACERKVMWISGAAAAFGAILGAVGANLALVTAQ